MRGTSETSSLMMQTNERYTDPAKLFQRLQPPAVELVVLRKDLKIESPHYFHRSRKASNNNIPPKTTVVILQRIKYISDFKHTLNYLICKQIVYTYEYYMSVFPVIVVGTFNSECLSLYTVLTLNKALWGNCSYTTILVLLCILFSHTKAQYKQIIMIILSQLNADWSGRFLLKFTNR